MTTAVRNFARWSPAVFEPEDDSWPQWKVQLELAAKLMGVTAEALDEQLLETDLARFVGKAGLPAEHVPTAVARQKLGSESGPMRRVDLMLRAGPFGDGFDDAADGLSLAKLRAVPHAVDLGPLESRLPDLLRTPGRRIALAHRYFLQDVPRLRAKLAAGAPGGMRLIGRRQDRNMNSWLHNLPVLAKGRQRCSLLVHPDDAARLGLVAGARARIRSRVGEIEVPVELSDDMMPGVVSLPHGFGHGESQTRLSVAASQQPGVNSNALSDEEALDPWSNTSIVNGIPVEVTRC